VKPPLTPMARLRYDRIRALMPPLARTVCEIGCGQGAVGYRLARRYRYVGVEPDEQSYAVARERIGDRGEVRHGDESAIGNEQFDVVCAFEVLEHMRNDRAALQSWLRHVRPGGHLLISVPAHQSRFSHTDDVVGHYRRYEPAELPSVLTEVGLTDVQMMLYGAPLGYLIENVRNRLFARTPTDAPAAERTAASGRLMQPNNRLVASTTAVGVLPFAVVQRAFPARGIGIVARGRRG
jgi:SAM-dependent methyltransferase